MNMDVVILAAGKGTRMRSAQAKVLHTLAGKSLIRHVVDAARTLNPTRIAVVVGHQSKDIIDHLDDDLLFVDQPEQLGTGHAVDLALKSLPATADDRHVTLILYGDVPLVEPDTLRQAIAAAETGGVGLVTAEFSEPAELGRILRAPSGRIERIVEFKDATAAQRKVGEINSGIMAVPTPQLSRWLSRLKPQNAQGEYYLTDIIEFATGEGIVVHGVVAPTNEEVAGVNDRSQLATLERSFQLQQANRLMLNGVSIADPARLDIRGQVTVGQDCFIDVNVILQGRVTLGDGVRIGAGSIICDSTLGQGTEVMPHTIVEGAMIAKNCTLGPYARIRAGSEFEDGVKIGNFVETKKTHVGQGSKASHLSYLGDAVIGSECNIGAGTVTCNYDGVNKHPTTIGDGVFVGTNSTLVAPLEIAQGAFVAAGSSVTVKVEAGDLAVGRAKQRNIKGWTRPDQRES